MEQSRLESLIEVVFGTLIGFVASFVVYPLACVITGVDYSGGQHFGMVGIFTVSAVARGYVVRRWFNGRLKRAAHRIAARVAKA